MAKDSCGCSWYLTLEEEKDLFGTYQDNDNKQFVTPDGFKKAFTDSAGAL